MKRKKVDTEEEERSEQGAMATIKNNGNGKERSDIDIHQKRAGCNKRGR